MKKLFLFMSLWFVASFSKAQCKVNVVKEGDSLFVYTAAKEKIYNEADKAGEVFFSSLQLIVRQHPSKRSELHYTLYAMVVKQGTSKPALNPRKINITFTDNTVLSLVSNKILDPRAVKDSQVYICEYVLPLNTFKQLREKGIKVISVTDDQLKKSFACNPPSEFLMAHANCIMSGVLKNQQP